MIFNKIVKKLQKMEDVTDTVVYRMAEHIIRDALERNCGTISLKCYPKKHPDILDALTVDEEDGSPIKLRSDDRGSYELGFFMKCNCEYLLYMTLPVKYFLPLLNILSVEKTEFKGRQSFVLYKESSAQKTIDRYVDVTIYLERDSSISLDIEEIK
jgi:hypothetical protein